MKEFNQYQFEDFLVRNSDLYTQTKDQIILDFLKDEGPSKILEVGCGSGELSFLLADRGHNVIGIDLASEYIALAHKRKTQGDGKCVFYAADLLGFELDKEFDVIIAMDVLEHIKDDKAAAAKLVGLLKHGGQLILTVPAHSLLFGFHDEELGHHRRYSKKTLANLMRCTGAMDDNNVRMRYFGFTFLPVCLLYSKLLRQPYPKTSLGVDGKRTILGFSASALLGLDKKISSAPFGISLVFIGTKKL